MKFNFGEKQGRIVLEIDCYLEMDLDNSELEQLFNEIDVKIKHKLISDIDVNAKTS